MSTAADEQARGWMRWAFVGIMVLSLLAGATTAMVYVQNKQAAECQSRLNKDISLAVVQRDEAGDTDGQALRQIAKVGADMIDVVLDPASSERQKLEAVTAWRQAQRDATNKFAEADLQRAENPIPNLDRQC